MKKSSGCLIKLAVFFVIKVVCLVSLALWFSSLQVTGVTFSPDDFSIRTFSYTRSTFYSDAKNLRVDIDNSLGMSLASVGLIKTGPPTTRHLVSDNKTDLLSRDLQASILVSYIRFENNYWVDWNAANPKLAAILWPTIQAMAYDRLYVLMPDLFDLASHSNDKTVTTSVFESKVRTSIIEELSKMVEERTADGDSEKANLYKKMISKYDPTAGPISLTPVQ